MARVCIDVIGDTDIEITVEVITSPVDAEGELYLFSNAVYMFGTHCSKRLWSPFPIGVCCGSVYSLC